MVNWHSDVSCDEEPPLGTMLQIHIAPDCGGDTPFCDMYAAYEALSNPIKELIGINTTHESEHLYRGRYSDRGMDDTGTFFQQQRHPVRTHPETGRKALFVNRTFTTRINELSFDESNAILNLLSIKPSTSTIKFVLIGQSMIWLFGITVVVCNALFGIIGQKRERPKVTIKGDRPNKLYLIRRNNSLAFCNVLDIVFNFLACLFRALGYAGLKAVDAS